jgi:hypothetical protein
VQRREAVLSRRNMAMCKQDRSIPAPWIAGGQSSVVALWRLSANREVGPELVARMASRQAHSPHANGRSGARRVAEATSALDPRYARHRHVCRRNTRPPREIGPVANRHADGSGFARTGLRQPPARLRESLPLGATQHPARQSNQRSRFEAVDGPTRRHRERGADA